MNFSIGNFALAASLLTTQSFGAEVYQCKQSNGRIAFQDFPCAPEATNSSKPSRVILDRNSYQKAQGDLAAENIEVARQFRRTCEHMAGGSLERRTCLATADCMRGLGEKSAAEIDSCAKARIKADDGEAAVQKAQKDAIAALPLPKVGMLTFEAEASRWGRPTYKRRSTTYGTDWEHWEYQGTRRLTFRDSVLVNIDW